MTTHVPAGLALPSADDLWLFAEGRHLRLWEVLGAHPAVVDGRDVTSFAVWAPGAQSIHVVGEWNGVVGSRPSARAPRGIGCVGGRGGGDRPAHRVQVRDRGPGRVVRQRCDPMAQIAEHRGGMASVVFRSGHTWGDQAWMAERAGYDRLRDRLSIYEVHLGSWRRTPDGDFLSYRDMAPLLADHVAALGLHPRGAAAGRRAPLRAVVGLSGHRLLRADVAVR